MSDLWLVGDRHCRRKIADAVAPHPFIEARINRCGAYRPRQCSKLASRRGPETFRAMPRLRSPAGGLRRDPFALAHVAGARKTWPLKKSRATACRSSIKRNLVEERRIITAAARFESNRDPRPHPVNVSITFDETWFAGFGDAGGHRRQRFAAQSATGPRCLRLARARHCGRLFPRCAAELCAYREI
jgi:hypothetical protein